jgi:hypothetical protein
MSKERRRRLMEFFEDYDPAVGRVVKRVLEWEQRYLDSKRPRVKEEIRDVIEEEVKRNDS